MNLFIHDKKGGINRSSQSDELFRFWRELLTLVGRVIADPVPPGDCLDKRFSGCKVPFFCTGPDRERGVRQYFPGQDPGQVVHDLCHLRIRCSKPCHRPVPLADADRLRPRVQGGEYIIGRPPVQVTQEDLQFRLHERMRLLRFGLAGAHGLLVDGAEAVDGKEVDPAGVPLPASTGPSWLF